MMNEPSHPLIARLDRLGSSDRPDRPDRPGLERVDQDQETPTFSGRVRRKSVSVERTGALGVATVSDVPSVLEVSDVAERLRAEDRLDLLRWVAAPERSTYLAILEVFDTARASYNVQLRPTDVLASLTEAGVTVDAEALGRALDALHGWRVLERSFDSSRVASIEEYRRRRPVFQFTELGERAYRGVRELLEAEPGEGQLQRFALREIAEQLEVLERAVGLRDGERALAALNRVDLVLGQLADRAGQFYVLVGVMTQEVEVNATRFVEMKDLLLGHLHEFLQDLHRWTPVVGQRILAIEQVGVAVMIDLVAESDVAVFQTGEQRQAAWRRRWDGLVTWFSESAGSRAQVAQLDRRTVAAIRELTALLRRLIDSRSRGAGRAADLVALAEWFWCLDGLPRSAAHGLYDATFSLGGANHLGTGYADPELTVSSASWSAADPVEVSISLRERGRSPSPGQSGAIPDDRRAREHFRDETRSQVEADQAAARRLADLGFVGRTLDRQEFDQLLRLTDLALASGVPVAGTVAIGSVGNVRVEIRPSATDTVIEVIDGSFVLHGVAVGLGVP